jgi:hypothetical protein
LLYDIRHRVWRIIDKVKVTASSYSCGNEKIYIVLKSVNLSHQMHYRITLIVFHYASITPNNFQPYWPSVTGRSLCIETIGFNKIDFTFEATLMNTTWLATWCLPGK